MRLSKESEQSSGKRQVALFVDANTIVSSLLFDGNESLLLRLGRISLCKLKTTRYVMDEVTRAFQSREFRLKDEEVASLLSYANKCITVYCSRRREQLLRYLPLLSDKKEVHVLAGFHELKCEILVTGYKELLRKISRARSTRQALEALLGERQD